MRQFKLSNDPRFVDKLRDVVGLYVDPPAHAIVLSVYEKSQIQALDRMVHFTPTSASWLNAVEGFFATLKRGVFRSVTDLQAAINRFLEEHNQQSKPLHLDRRSRQNHRRCQARASSVRFDPTSGSNLTFESRMGFPLGFRRASLRDARRKIPFGLVRRYWSAQSPGS